MTSAVEIPPTVRKPRVWRAWIMAPALMGLIWLLTRGRGILIDFIASRRLRGKTPEELHNDAFLRFLGSPWFFFGYIAILLSILVLIPVILAAKSPMGFSRRLTLVRPRGTWIQLVIIAAGAFGCGAIAAVVAYMLDARSATVESLHRVLRQASFSEMIFAFVVVGFIGPVCEEIIFRGYVQSRLIARHGPWVGILAASLLFGLWHHNLVQGAQAAAGGVYLGYAAWRTGSLGVSIAGHCVNNVVSMLIGEQEFLMWFLLPAAVIVAAAAIYFLVGLKPATRGDIQTEAETRYNSPL